MVGLQWQVFGCFSSLRPLDISGQQNKNHCIVQKSFSTYSPVVYCSLISCWGILYSRASTLCVVVVRDSVVSFWPTEWLWLHSKMHCSVTVVLLYTCLDQQTILGRADSCFVLTDSCFVLTHVLCWRTHVLCWLGNLCKQFTSLLANYCNQITTLFNCLFCWQVNYPCISSWVCVTVSQSRGQRDTISYKLRFILFYCFFCLKGVK